MDAPRRSHPPHALGRLGEACARDYLVARGWTIVARNYRFGRREVDVIVRRGDLITFVEVKTRAGVGFGSPAEAVTWRKRREIEAVAREYLVRHRLGDVGVRFDVISVIVDGGGVDIEHIEDAWRPGSDAGSPQ